MLILNKIFDWFYFEADVRTAKIYRILVGSFVLFSVLLFGPYVEQFFSSNGYVSKEVAYGLRSVLGGGSGYSIFFYYDSVFVVKTVWIITAISAALLTAGIYPRFFALLSWIGYVSFYNRNPQIGYGGSEVFFMLLFFLIFLRSDRNAKGSVSGWPLRLAQITTAMIYLFAGITKMKGVSWRDGSELLGVINSQYGLFPFYWLAEYPHIAAILTHLSTLIEIAFPFLVWFCSTRLMMMFFILALNINIILTINVTFFPHSMLAGLSSFLIASDYILFGNLFLLVKTLFNKVVNFINNLWQTKARYYIGLIVLTCFLINYYNISILDSVRRCPSGYIFVNANKELGGNNFCIMAYEAKKDYKTNLPISIPYQQPWTSISWNEARTACSSLGSDYSLISDRQWVSVANQIISTEINNLVEDNNPLFATGNSEKMGFALGAKYADVPYVWGCNKNVSASHIDNKFIDWFCEIRGGGNSLIKKGFAGTAATFLPQWNLDTSTNKGNRTFLRTHMLPTSDVIWDLSGNVWEWTDSEVLIESKSDKTGDFYSDANGIQEDLPYAINPITKADYVEFDQIKDWKKLSYAKPLYNGKTLNSFNGVGKIYLNPGESWGAGNEEEKKMKVILRGGAYGNPSEAGIFSLNLSYAPSGFQPYIGFRCVKNLN